GVEFWLWSNKDVDAIEAALDETGLAITGFVAEPMVPLTDPARHDEFLEGLKKSIAVAQRLGAPVLIAQAGADLPGKSRAEQRQALTDCLRRAADILAGSGVTLAVEPLNTLVDHAGYFLPSTVEGLDIIDDVGRPEIKILYDIYHSAVMSEDIASVLDGRLDRVAHVHLADTPGRHEPGSGKLDWQARVGWLDQNGYAGMIGLEYKPTQATAASLAAVLA
ncbi:MAG: TIM barrel protein, partial [Devosia sp.]|nr:TIM barrel protein [Devosia sp.]